MKSIYIITTEERLSKIINVIGDYVVECNDDTLLIEVPKLRWPKIRKLLQSID